MHAGSHVMRRSYASPQHRTRSLNAYSFVPAPCRLRLAAVAVAGFSLLSHAAEGPIASVQRSLKEQQFYYGEVTGQLDEETRAALRRFQIHQGIPVSAELDTATLQALQSSVKEPPAEQENVTNEPAAERSVRGRAQRLVQDDREFLEQIEGPEEAPAPATESPRREPEVERTPPPPPPVAD
ncbi:MAG: peptidoglycan-binding protein, partial [Verrucomicrobiaceae bacterium]